MQATRNNLLVSSPHIMLPIAAASGGVTAFLLEYQVKGYRKSAQTTKKLLVNVLGGLLVGTWVTYRIQDSYPSVEDSDLAPIGFILGIAWSAVAWLTRTGITRRLRAAMRVVLEEEERDSKSKHVDPNSQKTFPFTRSPANPIDDE